MGGKENGVEAIVASCFHRLFTGDQGEAKVWMARVIVRRWGGGGGREVGWGRGGRDVEASGFHLV